MKASVQALAWLLAAGGLALATGLAPVRPSRVGTPALELLGPVAELAANVQWVRFQKARIAGEEERALLFAEGALELAPGSTEGWELLASHLGFFLASAEREPDPGRRLARFRAAIEVTRRGEEEARRPAQLTLLRGILFLTKAEQDPDVWPGGAPELWREAANAFEEARSAGLPEAEDFARYANERAGS